MHCFGLTMSSVKLHATRAAAIAVLHATVVLAAATLLGCKTAVPPATDDATDTGAAVDAVADTVIPNETSSNADADTQPDTPSDSRWGSCQAVYTDVFPTAAVVPPEVAETTLPDFGDWCTPTTGPAKPWKYLTFYTVGDYGGAVLFKGPCAACGSFGQQIYQIRNDGQWRMNFMTTGQYGGIHLFPPENTNAPYSLAGIFDGDDPPPSIAGTLSPEDLACVNKVLSTDLFQHSVSCSVQVCVGPWDEFPCHDWASCWNEFGKEHPINDFDITFEDGSMNYEATWNYDGYGVHPPDIETGHQIFGDQLSGCYGPSPDSNNKIQHQYHALLQCAHLWEMRECTGL